MMQQATYKPTDLFPESLASEILNGKKTTNKISLDDFFKDFKTITPYTKDTKYNKPFIYKDFLNVLLHNISTAKSQKYIEKLVIRLQFHDNWKDVFNDELNFHSKKIAKSISKTRIFLNSNFFNIINENLEYHVNDVNQKELTLFDVINSELPNSFFAFIKKITSAFITTDLINREEFYGRGLTYKTYFDEKIKLLVKEGVEENYNFDYKDEKNFFNTLYKNTVLENVFEFTNMMHGNYYINENLLLKYFPKIETVIKILSRCFYLFYLKTSLKQDKLPLINLHTNKSFLGLSFYNDKHYRVINKNNIFNRPKENQTFILVRPVETLKILFNGINGTYVQHTDFNHFKKIFTQKIINEDERINWIGSLQLLAHFIELLYKEDIIMSMNDIWKRTEYCFNFKGKKINSESLKVSKNKSFEPNGYDDLKILIKESLP